MCPLLAAPEILFENLLPKHICVTIEKKKMICFSNQFSVFNNFKIVLKQTFFFLKCQKVRMHVLSKVSLKFLNCPMLLSTIQYTAMCSVGVYNIFIINKMARHFRILSNENHFTKERLLLRCSSLNSVQKCIE